MMTTELNLTLNFDREIFWKGGDSVRYLVAGLNAKQKGTSKKKKRDPLNIALVLDASGSMSGQKIESAKLAALGLVKHLHKDDRLSLVSFSSDIQVHFNAIKIDDESYGKIQSEITMLSARAMTNLSDGWFKGIDCAAKIAEENKKLTPRVIILSDGHANRGICNPDELKEHARELRNRGVMTSTLGIGNGYDELLLKGLAEEGGGRFHDAEGAEDISAVLLGELGDIVDTLVEGTQLELKIPMGVNVEALGISNCQVSDNRIKVSLGNILKGLDRHVVFKITCPRMAAGEKLAFDLRAKGVIPGSDTKIKTKAVLVHLESANKEKNFNQVRNIPITEVVAKHWNAFIVSEAGKLNRVGRYEDAGRFVRKEKSYLKRYVKGLDIESEMLRNLVILEAASIRDLSPRIHKEMTAYSLYQIENRADHMKNRRPMYEKLAKEIGS